MNQDKQVHYHFASGEVVFQSKDPERSGLQALRHNVMILSDSKNVRLKEIANIQAGLQEKMAQKLGPEMMESIVISDVVILNLMYLGEMTAADFQGGLNLASMETAANA